MSISPQSLARTRDKRSLKVPARFNDTVYNEVHYNEATEVLRASTRSRPSSLGTKRELEEDDPEEREEVMRAIKASNRSSSQSKKQNKSINNETNTTIVPAAATITITATSTAKATTISSSSTTQTRPLAEQIPNSPSTPPPSTTPSPISLAAAAAATASKPAAKRKSSSSSSRKKTNGTSLIFKRPPTSEPEKVEPSALLGHNLNVRKVQRTFHNQSMGPIPVPNTTPVAVIPGTPTQSAGNFINPLPRQFGNVRLDGHTQYGTRILINEPIYLPRSVGTIAPVTITASQAANLVRRPPFISKKTQACLAYQDARKLDNFASTFQALLKITRYLSVQDRLNFRQVSKTWKFVIDSTSVWDEVLFTTGDEKLSYHPIYKKHDVRDAYFDQYEPEDEIKIDPFETCQSIERLRVRSMNNKQNSFGLCSLVAHTASKIIQLPYRNGRTAPNYEWSIAISVDPCGLATVRLSSDYKCLDRGLYKKLIDRGLPEETCDMGHGKYFTIEFDDLKNIIYDFALYKAGNRYIPTNREKVFATYKDSANINLIPI